MPIARYAVSFPAEDCLRFNALPKSWTLQTGHSNRSPHGSGPVPEGEGSERPGPFGGTDRIGMIESGGVKLVNRHNLLFKNWSGFAISNQTDTVTPGFGNQASSFAGGGAGPDHDAFAVGFGYVHDLDPTQTATANGAPLFGTPGRHVCVEHARDQHDLHGTFHAPR